jgi:hypothetical protein
MLDNQTILTFFFIPYVIPVIQKLIDSFWCLLLRLIATRVRVDIDNYIRELDKIVISQYKNKEIIISANVRPINTWYLLWIKGPLIVTRAESYNNKTGAYYYIYGMNWSVQYLIKILKNDINIIENNGETITDDNINEDTYEDSEDMNNDDKIITKNKPNNKKLKVAYFEGCYELDELPAYLPSEELFKSQEEVVNLLEKNYLKRTENCNSLSKKGISALLIGKQGTGKTNTALYLAEKLNRNGINPLIVYGFDMTYSKVELEALWTYDFKKESPLILVLDEIDISFKYATTERNYETNSPARNKTTLNKFIRSF